jgi:hypothetical protein
LANMIDYAQRLPPLAQEIIETDKDRVRPRVSLEMK